jgi:hypothetical protein
MPDFEMHKIPCEFAAETTASEAPELSGPLGNLVRLLFSEAWRTKSHPSNRAATFDLTNLSRDFMRRNVAANHNIPQIALSQ